MKRYHFEKLTPICPVCMANNVESPLMLGPVLVERGSEKGEQLGDIIEGVLLCKNSACLREYPIIDGIPIIIADLRSYIANSVTAIDARDDLTPFTESLICDAAGPASDYETRRQHLSSYTWDHYADLDPDEPSAPFEPGAVVKALEDGLQSAQPLTRDGLTIDVGCSVGRTTFELANQTESSLVLGVDLNFSMLRTASRVLRENEVRYPRRRVGMVYDRREFGVQFPDSAKVDFWACDATALPFRESTFELTVGMNVLDCVSSPHDFFRSIARILTPNGKSVISCPYDWSPAATPVENWLGGHSQRSITRGDSAATIKQLFASNSGLPLTLDSVGEAPLWHVRLHDRSTMTYQNHRLTLSKQTASGQPEVQPDLSEALA